MFGFLIWLLGTLVTLVIASRVVINLTEREAGEPVDLSDKLFIAFICAIGACFWPVTAPLALCVLAIVYKPAAKPGE